MLMIAKLEDGSDSSLQESIYEIKGWGTKWSMPINVKSCILRSRIQEENIMLKERREECGWKRRRCRKIWASWSRAMAEISSRWNQQSQSQTELWVAWGRLKYFNIQILKVLYPAFVRTHLEFASAVWNSMSRKEINRLEGIQKRATKMVIELRGIVYEDRLKELGITRD